VRANHGRVYRGSDRPLQLLVDIKNTGPATSGAAREAVWRELVAAKVDHINTDDPAGLEKFLRANDRSAHPQAA
jgi:hypothetical protein